MANQLGFNTNFYQDGVKDLDIPEVTWVNCFVENRNIPELNAWINRQQLGGHKVLLSLVSHSFPDSNYYSWVYYYAQHLYPDAWKIGNEPDGSGVSSWIMSPLQYWLFYDECARAIREIQPDVIIVAGGFCGGNPDWDQGVNLDTNRPNYYAIHPYGQRPLNDWPSENWGFGYIWDLIRRYEDRYGKNRIWITEFGTNDVSIHEQYYAKMYHSLIQGGFTQPIILFAISDLMNYGYGMYDSNGMQKPSLTNLLDEIELKIEDEENDMAILWSPGIEDSGILPTGEEAVTPSIELADYSNVPQSFRRDKFLSSPLLLRQYGTSGGYAEYCDLLPGAGIPAWRWFPKA